MFVENLFSDPHCRNLELLSDYYYYYYDEYFESPPATRFHLLGSHMTDSSSRYLTSEQQLKYDLNYRVRVKIVITLLIEL